MLKIVARLSLFVLMFASPVFGRDPVRMGQFETVGGYIIEVELHEAVGGAHVEPVFKFSGTSDVAVEGVFMVPPENGTGDEKIEDFTLLPVLFRYHKDKGWIGRIESKIYTRAIKVIHDNKPINGFGFHLIVNKRATQFTKASTQRLNPAILGLPLGNVAIKSRCLE